MKNIISKLNESNQELCPEIQNEFSDDYAYQTFKIKKSKFKYGFLTFDKDDEFYSVLALNEDSEFAEEVAKNYNIDAEELFELKIGQTLSDDSHGPNYVYAITRIW